jgi:hypothetical protein
MMDNLTYTVITLDQKENKNISLETIKDWYSKRLIHEDSLIYLPQTGKWQRLEKTFNLSEFPPRVIYRQSSNFNTSAPFPQPRPNPQLVPSSQIYHQNPSRSAPFGNQSLKRSSPVKWIIASFGILALLVLGVGGYVLSSGVLRTALLTKEDRKFLEELKKIEVPGNEFRDPESGAVLLLPKGWRFLKPQNNILKVPSARIMATDNLGSRSAMLEVVTFTNERNEPLLRSSAELDPMIVNVETFLRNQSKVYTQLLSASISFKGEPGKKIIFERIDKPAANDDGPSYKKDLPIKGQIFLTIRGNRVYIFQMWCPQNDYERATDEFTQLENNLIIPPFQDTTILNRLLPTQQ